ncbi:hypothetical protein ABZ484_03355 [Streptomyces sp. NPDC006393]|uniref:hypothetical protein n=1 Tax=Streptomyces sp. NPDC006393 TaxID=3156763 RepID=UPI00340CAB92
MTMRRDVHERLRARLHEAAGAHEPDRARILARIERGMDAADRPVLRAARTGATGRPRVAGALGWLRVAGATAAVAGVLAVGGYAVSSAVRDTPRPQRQTVAVPPAPSPVPSPDAGPATTERDGPLRADASVDPHSNDYWAQSDITLRTSEPLTALTVRLEVAQTGGVASTGAWRSLPEPDFTLTVGERNGFLVYTWTLKAGRTVPAGTWVFAGQYNHDRGGRNARQDRYTATATAQGRHRSVTGDFRPRDGDGGSDSAWTEGTAPGGTAPGADP